MTDDYKIELRSNITPVCCDSCGYPGGDLLFEPWPRHLQETMASDGNWFCGLCRGTAVSRVISYGHMMDIAVVLQTICYVGNAVIGAVRDGKRGSEAVAWHDLLMIAEEFASARRHKNLDDATSADESFQEWKRKRAEEAPPEAGSSVD